MGATRVAVVSILFGALVACGGGGGSPPPPPPPPGNLTYSTNPAVYTKGVAVAKDTPSSTGGAVASYSVLPSLPAGLSLDASTGVISGTPTAITARNTYTVTATNSGGSTTAGVVITVNDAAPGGLAYSTNPAVYTKGVVIPSSTPSSTGGAVVSYSVLPSLPAGLSLDASTGAISGTPTAITTRNTYTVTAANTGGSTTAGVVITVNDMAPSGLAYSTPSAVYTKGAVIPSNAPTSTGGPVVSYSVLPSLPAGLTLDVSTGAISGSPTAVTAQNTYVVTATNTGGSTTAGVVITVNDIAPSGLAYSTNPAVYTKGTVIASNTPSGTGGAVVSYSVLPALPAGLSLDASTGAISGTPTAVTARNTYVVTATNSGGSTTAGVVITVNDVAPSGLVYSTNPAVYTKGAGITGNTPSSAGGAVVSYSVSPALPAGLSLGAATGVISGTPTAVTARNTYAVTATNSGGFTTASVVITVNDVAPSTLAYSTNPAVYPVGVAITGNTPTSAGGAVVSYSVSPSLPAGLTLDAVTGVISGTPSAVTAQAIYTITATNTGGSAFVGLVITVACDSMFLADPAKGVFVDVVAGNDTTGNGSTTAPYATIGKGVDAARIAALPNVYVAPGTYSESVTIADSTAGVSVNGGWVVAGTWVRDCNRSKTVLQGGSVAVRANLVVHDSGFTHMTIQTQPFASGAPPDGDGASLIGLLVQGASSRFYLRDVAVSAGDAGAAGVGGSGAAGATCVGGGYSCSTGATGSAGGAGAAASVQGTFGATGFTPSTGATGVAGVSGQPGIAGGAGGCTPVYGCSGGACGVYCSYGQSGQVCGTQGTCGCGGSGGSGGNAGRGGGASAAVVVAGTGASLTLSGSALRAGNGGAGSVGGAGGSGAAGLAGSGGATQCAMSSTGCFRTGSCSCGLLCTTSSYACGGLTTVCGGGGSVGGPGGNGGTGGGGGGGAGGPSYALVTAGGATATVDAATTLSFGTGGLGAAGAAPGGAAAQFSSP